MEAMKARYRLCGWRERKKFVCSVVTDINGRYLYLDGGYVKAQPSAQHKVGGVLSYGRAYYRRTTAQNDPKKRKQFYKPP